MKTMFSVGLQAIYEPIIDIKRVGKMKSASVPLLISLYCVSSFCGFVIRTNSPSSNPGKSILMQWSHSVSLSLV